MASGILTALIAVACVGLASIGFSFKLRALRFAAVGLAAGYAIGAAGAFVLGFLHVSLPPVQFGNVAYTSSVWLPPVFGISGMAVGTMAAMFHRRNGT